MPLSDTAIKNAKPSPDKPYKLPDEKGMYLLVHSNGGKYFRLDYRFSGKRKTLALGTYPETTLKAARDKRDTAKKQMADGIDPGENRKAVKQSKAENAANSFEVIAREWGGKKVETWAEKNNRSKRMLERNIFPWLGSKPITDILPKDILDCLRRVEERGTIETAHRTLQICGQVFRYAVATGRIERDITPDLRGALPPAKGEHFAAITEPKAVAELLRAIDGYQGSLPSVCALKLAPLVFVRPGELRAAEWQHIDLEAKEWRYLVSKTDVQHIVPLSDQAVAILQELQPLTGHGQFVFPSERTPRGDRCMSENTLNAALKRLGYGKDVMTAHGFRAMARTILDEVLGFRPDFIEHQLAHAVKDPNGRAYNRTAHLADRKKMMQSWADYLDGLKNGAQVIAFKKAG
ncbi:integrase arm-type DNA-binding domain-containing protein [Methylovulum psychrotolerans]|uniref:tyrosine-type recombinase/integrase n=1 Tax=Methylovulum psychrotolerans TaxID=1704499 RepID=UPI001BFFBF49|nr:integrase arm-type DNA-binding domain-containing protein [Methylovulum psychrotolerans]MBT9096400.1 integrase arm-type DNA-binding domain-containing protein [Methylovulum psychrotolerans]